MKDYNSDVMRSVDWAGDLDSVLPKLKSLEVLVEVRNDYGQAIYINTIDGLEVY